MIVLKFGGTSVATAENILKAKDIVASKQFPVVVVVSALGGITDKLLTCARLAVNKEDYSATLSAIETRHVETIKALIPYSEQSAVLAEVQVKFNKLVSILEGIRTLNELSDKSIALISSLGEILSSYIISKAFQAGGLNVKHLDSRDIIKTDSTFLKAKIDKGLTAHNFLANTSGHDIYLMGGFIASNKEGITTTLGRGGSDYTASIAAACLNAEHLEIWTDVNGILSADPKLVNQAVSLKSVSYEEAMELSHFGAKVIYPPTIIPAQEKEIPIYIKNTFEPESQGTKIYKNGDDHEASIKGITSIKNITLISVIGSGMIGIPGFSYRMFQALSNRNVSAILITQASSEYSITVGISAADKSAALSALEQEFALELKDRSIEEIRVDEDMAIVSVVGNNMRHQVGLSGKLFSTLGKNGINIISLAQGSTERNVSTVIHKNDLAKAVNVLHETFFEYSYATINLFIMGVGLVGSELLQQIAQQRDFIKQNDHVDIRVVGLSNSRKMVLDPEGIDLNNWQASLDHSDVVANHEAFLEAMRTMNLRNSIFVDNTASESVAQLYTEIAQNNFSIVTCNKIAAAAPLEAYNSFIKAVQKNRVTFRNETNVGASLPIISTIKDMVNSGDKIRGIEAVLSGSLNFIFNNYDTSRSFADVVREAQKEGYTEPDPRVDLSGMDVKRKILILARVSGYALDQDEVETISFLPDGSMEAEDVDAFYALLEQKEDYFQALYKNAASAGKKLKVVATFDGQSAKVALQEVGPDSAYFNLGGKDNIVLLTSDRYPSPLVIRGAGAGAAVTASGVFGDILKVWRS
ncbi:MAG: bifunctional aspartate kinase/homoserine dehydrogenase I [Saprospiraceae bacterium]|nr:bifunctional aspartate kinase/homoserine dehydrogenase I [Saprospiraceae bacterium]